MKVGDQKREQEVLHWKNPRGQELVQDTVKPTYYGHPKDHHVEERWFVVRALDFKCGGRWFEPSLCHRVVSLDKIFYPALSLFTQV